MGADVRLLQMKSEVAGSWIMSFYGLFEVKQSYISTEEETCIVSIYLVYNQGTSFKIWFYHHQHSDILNKTCCTTFTCNKQIRIEYTCSEPAFASRLASTNFHMAVQKPGFLGWSPHIFITQHDCSLNKYNEAALSARCRSTLLKWWGRVQFL